MASASSTPCCSDGGKRRSRATRRSRTGFQPEARHSLNLPRRRGLVPLQYAATIDTERWRSLSALVREVEQYRATVTDRLLSSELATPGTRARCRNPPWPAVRGETKYFEEGRRRRLPLEVTERQVCKARGRARRRQSGGLCGSLGRLLRSLASVGAGVSADLEPWLEGEPLRPRLALIA